jgi:hypothetical protein
MSSLGSIAFAARCYCHGNAGQGYNAQRVIGPGSNLASYGTALGLFNKNISTMPPAFPGSLSRQDYLNILVFMLVGNIYLKYSDIFVEANMTDIALK